MTSSLAHSLCCLGLHRTGAELDDLVARATKGRFSPTQLLVRIPAKWNTRSGRSGTPVPAMWNSRSVSFAPFLDRVKFLSGSRTESPVSLSRWALCTSRSRMASARCYQASWLMESGADWLMGLPQAAEHQGR